MSLMAQNGKLDEPGYSAARHHGAHWHATGSGNTAQGRPRARVPRSSPPCASPRTGLRWCLVERKLADGIPVMTAANAATRCSIIRGRRLDLLTSARCAPDTTATLRCRPVAHPAPCRRQDPGCAACIATHPSRGSTQAAFMVLAGALFSYRSWRAAGFVRRPTPPSDGRPSLP